MVALKMNSQQTRTLPIDSRHRQSAAPRPRRRSRNVTHGNCVLATWPALRVLIVGDEQHLTFVLFALVAANGHAARMACHGQAALIAAADQLPEVVLLNLELFTKDGRRLASQLRRSAPQSDCFIIALVDWADDERRRQCREAGIDLLLVKSVHPSVLDLLLGLEWVRINRQRSAEAGDRDVATWVESLDKTSELALSG